VTAEDASEIEADAGAGAFIVTLSDSKLNVAAGAAAAVNSIEKTVQAGVARTAVDAGRNVTVEAVSETTIKVFALGIAGVLDSGTGGGASFAGAGSGAGNGVAMHTLATFDGGSILATGALTVRATDTTLIRADAGGVAIVLARGPPLAIGISVAANTISNETRARIEGASKVTAGDIDIVATSEATIDALTFAGGGAFSKPATPGASFSFAGAGAGSGNHVRNTVEAKLAKVPAVTGNKAGTATVVATDTATILADAGSVAITLSLRKSGGVDITVGAAAAVNDIANTVTATVDQVADFDAPAGGLLVEATSAATVDVLAFGIAGALTSNQGTSFSFTGAGSGAGNTVGGETSASIVSSTVETAGDVAVAAANRSSITADAGAAALAIGITKGTDVKLAFAVSAAMNTIKAPVKATVDKTSVTGRRVDVTASSLAAITALTLAGAGEASIGAGAGVGIGGAGAGSQNTVAITVQALVEASTVTATSGSVTVAASETGKHLFDLDTPLELTLGDLARVVADDQATSPDEEAADRADDAAALSFLRSQFALGGTTLGSRVQVLVLVPDSRWLVYDVDAGAHYVVTKEGLKLAVTREALVRADAGGIAAAVSLKASTSGTITVGAALAVNLVANTISAIVRGASTVTATGGGVSVVAAGGAVIDVLTIGIAGAITAGSGGGIAFAGAGSASVNSIASQVQALVESSTIDTAGGVTVAATDSTRIIADAGAGALSVAVGTGVSAGIAVGISAAVNQVGDVVVDGVKRKHFVLAAIRGSVVGSDDKPAASTTVAATSTAAITALTVTGVAAGAGGAGGGAGISGAGSGSKNEIRAAVDALVDGTSTVKTAAGRAVSVIAVDAAVVKAYAGSLAIAAAGGKGRRGRLRRRWSGGHQRHRRRHHRGHRPLDRRCRWGADGHRHGHHTPHRDHRDRRLRSGVGRNRRRDLVRRGRIGGVQRHRRKPHRPRVRQHGIERHRALGQGGGDGHLVDPRGGRRGGPRRRRWRRRRDRRGGRRLGRRQRDHGCGVRHRRALLADLRERPGRLGDVHGHHRRVRRGRSGGGRRGRRRRHHRHAGRRGHAQRDRRDHRGGHPGHGRRAAGVRGRCAVPHRSGNGDHQVQRRRRGAERVRRCGDLDRRRPGRRRRDEHDRRRGQGLLEERGAGRRKHAGRHLHDVLDDHHGRRRRLGHVLDLPDRPLGLGERHGRQEHGDPDRRGLRRRRDADRRRQALDRDRGHLHHHLGHRRRVRERRRLRAGRGRDGRRERHRERRPRLRLRDLAHLDRGQRGDHRHRHPDRHVAVLRRGGEPRHLRSRRGRARHLHRQADRRGVRQRYDAHGHERHRDRVRARAADGACRGARWRRRQRRRRQRDAPDGDDLRHDTRVHRRKRDVDHGRRDHHRVRDPHRDRRDDQRRDRRRRGRGRRRDGHRGPRHRGLRRHARTRRPSSSCPRSTPPTAASRSRRRRAPRRPRRPPVGALGGVAVGAFLAKATIAGATRAYVGRGGHPDRRRARRHGDVDQRERDGIRGRSRRRRRSPAPEPAPKRA
jgi:hypothetical protein